jgi:transposase
VVFYDEFGWSFLERLRRTWAPRGQRPLIRRVTKDRRVLTTAAGLTLSGRIFKRHFAGGMKSCHVIEVLEYLRRYLPGGFILVCDHAPIHTSRETLNYLFSHLEIIVEPLPKYAPELNPEEYCHGHVKTRLANAVPKQPAEMRQLIDRGFDQLRRKPHLLLGFLRAAGLPVKQLIRP